MHHLIKKTLKLSPLIPLQVLLFITPQYLQSAQATPLGEFDLCIRELIDTGLTANQAAEGCAKAFRPEELAYCVTRINFHTQITPETLLNNCFQVRRPTELANCVVDIRLKGSNNIDPNEIMGYCRRSLLPQRFANCVLSVNKQGNKPLGESLDICITTKNNQY